MPVDNVNETTTMTPQRQRLPDERRALTHHFSVGGQEGYLTVGLFDDGRPGEIFIKMAKEGSTVSGLMDSFATAVSLALQFGAPLATLVAKFSHTRFEPSGWSGNPRIGYAKSVMDYIFRYLEIKFLNRESGTLFETPSETPLPGSNADPTEALGDIVQLTDGPTCSTCGSIMVRSGSCHRCMTCGARADAP